MAFLAVDADFTECIFKYKPYRQQEDLMWVAAVEDIQEVFIELPQGTIKKLTGRTLTWDDEPVELEEETTEGGQ